MLKAFCTLLFLPWLAHGDFTVPPLTGPVVDRAGMLSDSTRESMDRFLRRLKESGGTQLQVLTVPDLGGLSIEEASIRVVDQWKLGSARDDNGVLLMVAAAEKRIRIEVGQGREGVLTDAASGRIIRDVILPEFRRGDPNRALTKGVFAILHYTDPEFLDRDTGVSKAKGGELRVGVDLIIFLLIVFAFIVLPFMAGRRRRGIWRGYGGGYSGGSWGGGSWGGGGFGGGGGGWSGGGGGFSGGGASGGW